MFSESLFEIKRNTKTLLFLEAAGIVLIITGCTFLIFFYMVSGIVGKGIFGSMIGVWVLIIFYSVKNMNSVLIKADLSGIWFNVTFSAKGVFIPWIGMKRIDSEYTRMS
jgi:hypothetical protein